MAMKVLTSLDVLKHKFMHLTSIWGQKMDSRRVIQFKAEELSCFFC